MKKIAIIGGGISGISVAKILKNNHKVVVFEKSKEIGGLIKCEKIDGNLYHKVGGHVFNSKNKKVLDWFWSNFDRNSEFLKAKRNAKIFLNDKFINYPIEEHLYELDNSLARKIIKELVEINSKSPKTPDNFKDFLKINFGNTLNEIYFKPYNEKIWRTDLSNIPLEWLEGKLPMPDFHQIIINNILRENEKEMVHSSFFYPKNGGSQFIINRLSRDLDIKNNHEINSIDFHEGKIKVTGYPELFNVLIYTGDVRKLPKMINLEISHELLEEIYNLRSNPTSNILCECDANDLSWLYLPEQKFKCHRIIYTGNFSPSNNNCNSGKITCVVEFIGKLSWETMHEEIKKLPGNLKPLSNNINNASYIIQNNDSRQTIKKLKQVLSQKNIYLVGRFAEWEYFNMDKCIESSMNLTDVI